MRWLGACVPVAGFLAPFALAVSVLRPRPLRLLASLAVFVAGLAVFFIGPHPW